MVYYIIYVAEYAVTPLVGVWIETLNQKRPQRKLASLPSWECGLKLSVFDDWMKRVMVTPLVGVWIETHPDGVRHGGIGHSPRGSVD